MRQWSCMLIFGFLALAGGAAGAQDNEAGSNLPRVPVAPLPQRALGGVLTIYVWKMTEAVGLTEEQAAQTFPKIREAFQARWRSAARRQRLLLSLQRAMESAPQQKDGLERLLSQWEENEVRLQASQRDMLGALKKVLTLEQQVRYLLFEEKFQGDLVRVITEIRRDRFQRELELQGPRPR